MGKEIDKDEINRKLKEENRQLKEILLKVYADMVALGYGTDRCYVCRNNVQNENCWDVSCKDCPKATLCECSTCTVKSSNFVSQYMDEVIRMTKEGEK